MVYYRSNKKKKSYCVCFNKFVDSHNNRWWIIFSMISLFINAILFFFLDENDSNVHLEIYCLWICKSIKFISNLYSCIFCYKLFDFLIALSNRAYYPIICKNGKKKSKTKTETIIRSDSNTRMEHVCKRKPKRFLFILQISWKSSWRVTPRKIRNPHTRSLALTQR